MVSASFSQPVASAAGIIVLLDEPDDALKRYALVKLNAVVDDFWPEISDAIEKIEQLHEREDFADRELAALVASKVFYHLGAYGDSLQYALSAGKQFDVSLHSEYVQTIIGNAIDQYTEERVKQYNGALAEVDPSLEDIANRMFERCFESKEHEQAAGIALEARRMDILERAVRESGSVPDMLAYVFKAVLTIVFSRKFCHEVLRLLASIYSSLESTDHFAICQCYIVLNEPVEVASTLKQLVQQSQTSLALQLAFDLYEHATQPFLALVRSELSVAPAASADPSADAAEAESEPAKTLETINKVLSGEITLRLYVEFLSRNNHADMLILKNTQEAVQRNSVCHSATVIANSLMYAGTTSDVFLRENREWLQRAINWAKFSAVASFGVIHKGHTADAMTILSPYLPKEGTAGSAYEKGGSLYALGLICANHGAGVTDYLLQQLRSTNVEVEQHGGALGLGLAAMASNNNAAYDTLKGVLFSDSAVAGEAAGIAMGLVMLGSANEEAINDMTLYASETEHEKIIRGLSLGIAFTMYGRLEQADALIEQLLRDKDPIVRTSACHTIAMAYIGTNENRMLSKLLHVAVSDVNDDVRRAAVTALAFLLFRTPEQVPSVVSLLSESFNPHVRYGSCMALGIACAGTGLKEAIALIEPMCSDSEPFVRQGAYVALAMIMIQQPNSHPKSQSIRKLFAKSVSDKHEDVLAKFGAIYAQGIIEAGGRNVTIQLSRDHGHVDMPTAVGLLVFTQFWFWFPLGHFLSMALRPTAVICLNADLKMPKIEIKSNVAPSTYAYPPAMEPPKEKSKEKVATAVLSISAKAKKAKKEAAAAAAAAEGAPAPMDTSDDKASTEEPKEGGSAKEEEAKEEETKEPEADFEMLANPARVVIPQLEVISFPAECRYAPVRPGPLVGGIVVLKDSTPGEEEELIELAQAADQAGDAAEDTKDEPEPPAAFVFNPDEEEEEESTA
eukprot:m.484767 g.484767  ORF g.484767 m.484767 type:complete len:964 (+) comp23539_c0_seq1:200-3091(+)